MKLYVIRHGLTKCNIEKRYNGKLDEDINETGILQAKKAQEIIKNIDIDLIICSPLLRTRHTCNIININDVIYKYNLNPTLGIYWDLEEANYVARKNNLSVNQLGNLYDSMTRTFMNKINSNYKSGIYANLNYANNIFNEYTRQNLKWIAQWSNRCDFMYKYNLWQYSNNGSVPGIVGRVDLDYYYE